MPAGTVNDFANQLNLPKTILGKYAYYFQAENIKIESDKENGGLTAILLKIV